MKGREKMEFAKFVKDVMKGGSKDYQLELILQNAKVYENYNISEDELLEICNQLAAYMSNFNSSLELSIKLADEENIGNVDLIKINLIRVALTHFIIAFFGLAGKILEIVPEEAIEKLQKTMLEFSAYI